MAMELSVHDNYLLGYSVRCDERTIVLHTEYPHHNTPERTDVYFGGVIAYDFEADEFGNIIFDVYEQDLAKTVEENAALFARLKSYGWPGGLYSYESLPLLIQKLAGDGVRAFVLSSSIGMTGFILAKTMEFRSV